MAGSRTCYRWERIVSYPSRMGWPFDGRLWPSQRASPGTPSVARALIGPGINGADVVIIGAGPIGLLVAAVALYRGADRTTVVDLQRYPLEVATRVGVDRAIAADQLPEGGDGLEGDVVFECSGTLAGLNSALRSARGGGTVVQVGIPPAGEQPVEAALIVARELTVVGSLRMDIELEAAVAFLADREVKVDPLISHVLPADQAVDAFAIASDPNRSTKVLLDFRA